MTSKKNGTIPCNTIPQSFISKKQSILKQLAVPDDQYDDLSPKGSVDAEITDFVHELNTYDGLVTTSSCSGRISVFLEGRKTSVIEQEQQFDSVTTPQYPASKGGKGGGGRWLYVSHTPLSLARPVGTEAGKEQQPQALHEFFQLQRSSGDMAARINPSRDRLVHLKFEPMILHVLAANASTAQRMLAAALQCGFRESGASSLHVSSNSTEPHPIPIAIRTTGLAFDNIIGYYDETAASTSVSNGVQHDDGGIAYSLVSEAYLSMLVAFTTAKFEINKQKTEKLRALLAKEFGQASAAARADEDTWEDKDIRRARKREEGLRRKEELLRQDSEARNRPNTEEVVDGLEFSAE